MIEKKKKEKKAFLPVSDDLRYVLGSKEFRKKVQIILRLPYPPRSYTELLTLFKIDIENRHNELNKNKGCSRAK